LDLVSSRWFLHEFPDQAASLREIKRVVKEGGVVVAVDFVAPSHASQSLLNRYILPEEHARTCDGFAAPWAETGLAIEAVGWHARRMEKNADVREAVCGPHTPVAQEVKNELHVTCNDEHLYLDVPIAIVVAHKTESFEARRG
jgi:SAM-dependent methyltransferase